MDMSSRQPTRDAARVKFRKAYRDAIHPRYSGAFHLGAMLFWGSAAIWLCLRQVTQMGGAEG